MVIPLLVVTLQIAFNVTYGELLRAAGETINRKREDKKRER